MDNNKNDNEENNMSLYDGIREAKVSKTSDWLKPGFHKVEISGVKEQRSAANTSQVYFIVEMKLLETDNDALTVGKEYSQVIDIGKQMGFANIKIFVAAISGVDPDEEDVNSLVEAYWSKVMGDSILFPQICEILTSDAQPAEGQVMTLEARSINTKEGGTFTKHLWNPIEVD